MTFWSFASGVVVGLLAAAAATAVVVWLVLRTGREAGAADRDAKAATVAKEVAAAAAADVASQAAAAANRDEWPPVVVKALRAVLNAETTPETARWLNAVLMRYWLELRVSKLFKERMITKMVTKLRRKMDSSFVVCCAPQVAGRVVVGAIAQLGTNRDDGWAAGYQHDIDISDLNLGNFPPEIKRVHLCQNNEMNEELLVVRSAACPANSGLDGAHTWPTSMGSLLRAAC